MKCPRCGTENASENAYCVRCGAKLDAAVLLPGLRPGKPGGLLILHEVRRCAGGGRRRQEARGARARPCGPRAGADDYHPAGTEEASGMGAAAARDRSADNLALPCAG
ncbi:MAG: zinc-ribbon domain-containing protein [Anaerolineales bacterium]|nr:zinc-ribbon domain-containing protein [Anaerolineales bacterium]